VWPAIVTSNFTTPKMDKDWAVTHALPGVQVNLIKNPTISKNLNFPRQKKVCIFLPLEQKMWHEKTQSFKFFLQIVCLNGSLILKRVGGNFEMIEILVQLSKKNMFFF
jgi:hypothetical protein